jgi:hypothetical protein
MYRSVDLFKKPETTKMPSASEAGCQSPELLAIQLQGQKSQNFQPDLQLVLLPWAWGLGFHLGASSSNSLTNECFSYKFESGASCWINHVSSGFQLSILTSPGYFALILPILHCSCVCFCLGIFWVILHFLGPSNWLSRLAPMPVQPILHLPQALLFFSR